MSDDLDNRCREIIDASYDQNVDSWRENATMIAWSALQKCESPIERLMGSALSFAFGNAFLCTMGPLCAFFEAPPGDQILIEMQKEIGRYRVDFAITANSAFADNIVVKSQVVVECDGHAFHEKTPAQAQRDKERDRFLLAQGWTVMRFTGSEIVRDPIACARSVVEQVEGEFLRQGTQQWRAANG